MVLAQRVSGVAALVIWLVMLAGCQSNPQTVNAEVSEVSGPQPSGSTSADAQLNAEPVNRTPSEPKATPSRPEADSAPGVDAAVASIQARAQGYLVEHRWQESIAAAEQGLRVDRRHAPFYEVLAESYRSLGDVSQAQRFAEQAVRLCRHDCEGARRLLNTLISQ